VAALIAIMPMTIREFLAPHQSAEILCAYTKNVVRRIALTQSGTVEVDAITESVEVSADAKVRVQPCFWDRGNILVDSIGRGTIKLCTEADVVRFADGTERYAFVQDQSPGDVW